MNAYCAQACRSPQYLSALADKGFKPSDTVQYGGKTYTHDDIAEMTHDSYARHRGEFTMVMGGGRRSGALNRKTQRQFERTVKSDVYSSFHISWWTIAFGVLTLLESGPLGLVIAVVACLFEYYLSKDLDGDQALMAAVGA